MNLLFPTALLQFALGVSVLLLVVPIWLGALHQGGALVLFGMRLWAHHQLRLIDEPRSQPVPP